jgi:4'-phosphopantetheinyl transferase
MAATSMLRWLAAGEADVPADSSWLTTHELQLAAEMRFTKRRNEYLLRRWAGKVAVGTVLGRRSDPGALAGIEVSHHPSGAPYAVVDGRPAGLSLSLSDRAGWAVCLVGPADRNVGCDVELVEPRSAGFVSDFFTAAEQEQVAAADVLKAKDLVANLVWSAKESALKVLQTGLRRDTLSVEVRLAAATAFGGWAPLTVTTVEGEILPGWYLRAGQFVVTVAADRQSPPPSALAGFTDLRTAGPVHSWLDRPVS